MKIIFLHGEIFEFSQFFFCLNILFNVNILSWRLGELGDGDGAQSATAIVHFFSFFSRPCQRSLALCLQESRGRGESFLLLW